MSNKKFLDLDGLTRYDEKIKEYVKENTEVIQYATMPIASNENLNKIIQYTGKTNDKYTNGYFYKCVYMPAGDYPVTEELALNGITNATIPEQVILETPFSVDEFAILISEDDSAGHSAINIHFAYDSEHACQRITYTVYDNIKGFSNTGSLISYDGLTYNIDDSEGQDRHYEFSTLITFRYDWGSAWPDNLEYFISTILFPRYIWERVDIQPSEEVDAYTKAETDALFAETDAQIDGLETAVGKLAFRGFYGGNSFDTNANEPGVYFVRTDSFSDGHGHSSTPTNYGFHPGTFFGVVYLLKKYDTAQAGDILGYVVGTSSGINNNGWAACFKKVSGGNYISYSGYGEPTNYTFLTTSTNQTGISGKKTFTTLPESSVVPTTNNQLVNKKYVDDSIANIPVSPSIQYSTMPEASASTVGNIIQYVGEDVYDAPHDLTEEEAINGISSFTLPVSFHLDEVPTIGDEIELAYGATTKVRISIKDDSGRSGPQVVFTDYDAGISKHIQYWEDGDDPTHLTYSLTSEDIPKATFYSISKKVYLTDTWKDFAGPILQQVSQEPVYENGCFYKGIANPLVPLTRDEALAGVLKFSLPETIVLDSLPADDTEVRLSNSTESVIVHYYALCGVESKILVHKIMGSAQQIWYSSIDGLHFSLDGTPQTFTFSEEAHLITEWDDFAGKVLLQDPSIPYSWEQKDVQPKNKYYTKAEIDAMLGDINTILSTLTLPTQVEQELSEL